MEDIVLKLWHAITGLIVMIITASFWAKGLSSRVSANAENIRRLDKSAQKMDDDLKQLNNNQAVQTAQLNGIEMNINRMFDILKEIQRDVKSKADKP